MPVSNDFGPRCGRPTIVTRVAALIFAALVLGSIAPTSVLAMCGNGVVEGGEECDPGGALHLDGNPANATCTTGGDCFYESSCCKFNCQFVGQGATCFDGDLCTLNDTCDQVGNCGGNLAPEATPCDDDLFCTLNDECNQAGVCVGTGNPCSGGSECQDICDEAADTCNSPNGTPCGNPVDHECNGADTCDGAGSCQANLAVAGTPAPALCNDAIECTDDVCDGLGTCDNPALSPGTPCGDPSDTACTNPDVCDGAGVCITNDETPGTVCGDPSDTECTNPDTCDVGGVCVSNDELAGTACGDPSDDECNGADTCDGAGTCLDNVSIGGAAAPTTCFNGNECTADECDGTGGCANPDLPGGSPCGDPTATDCNGADTCNGLGSCLQNLVPDTTPCDDGDECTLLDACDAGVCVPTDAVVCDDADLCTYDSCDPLTGLCSSVTAPAPTCRVAPLNQLKILDKGDDTRDKLKWKWAKGDDTPFGDLGTPDLTTMYELCIYDSIGDVSTLVTSLIIPPSSNWSAKNEKFYKYKDKSATFGGVSKMKLRAIPSPSMGVKAQGGSLPLPAPASFDTFFHQDSFVTVQLVTDEGQCWAAEFEDARRNTGNRFIAKRVGIVIK